MRPVWLIPFLVACGGEPAAVDATEADAGKDALTDAFAPGGAIVVDPLVSFADQTC